MKLVCPALFIAFASSTVLAAPSQPAEPAPTALHAPPAQRLELARRFVRLTLSPDKYMEMIRTGAAAAVSASVEDADEADKAVARKDLMHVLTLMEPKVRERLPNLQEAYALAYAREFSADELQQLIAFVQTPAGQHYQAQRMAIETDPAVMMQQEGFAIDVAPIMDQLRKEKCAERTAQRIAAGDKKAKCPLSSEPETGAG